MWFSKAKEEVKATTKPEANPIESHPIINPFSEEELYQERTFNIRFKFLESNNIGLETVKPAAAPRRKSFFQWRKEAPTGGDGEEMPNLNSSVQVTLQQPPITLPEIIIYAQENEGAKELTILRCSLLPQFDVEIFKTIMFLCKTKGSLWDFAKESSGEETLKIFLIGTIFQVRFSSLDLILHSFTLSFETVAVPFIQPFLPFAIFKWFLFLFECI